MTIGEKIRILRNHTGLTQRALGKLSGTSETTIKQYELGKRQPRIEQLKKIAKFFDFPLYLLLDDNFELENVELEMKRARPVNSYEMAEPPKPFTVPLSSRNNNDGSIRVNTDTERERLGEEAQKIIIKQESSEEITAEEAQKVSEYIERTREDYYKLSKSIKDCAKMIDKYLSQNTQMPEEIVQILKENRQKLTELTPTTPDFYENLNDIGRQKATEQIDLLTKIPEYQKEPSEPPQD